MSYRLRINLIKKQTQRRGVRVLVMFHFLLVHYTFSSVWVAELPPFWKYLPSRSVICSAFCLFVIFIYFPFMVLRAGFTI